MASKNTESRHLPAVPRLRSTATQNTQNTRRIRKVQSGWKRRKGILPMILPTIRKSCTVNWSLFLSTSIRESRTTCYRKQKDKLLWVFFLKESIRIVKYGTRGYRFHKDVTARSFTQMYCAPKKLSETLPVFSKSTWIIIWFSEIITTGSF